MKQRFSPVVLAMAAIAVAFIALPILAILVRAPWSDAWDIVAQKTTRDALLVSLQTSVIAAFIASTIGIPLSWVLARSSGRGPAAARGAPSGTRRGPSLPAGANRTRRSRREPRCRWYSCRRRRQQCRHQRRHSPCPSLGCPPRYHSHRWRRLEGRRKQKHSSCVFLLVLFCEGASDGTRVLFLLCGHVCVCAYAH